MTKKFRKKMPTGKPPCSRGPRAYHEQLACDEHLCTYPICARCEARGLCASHHAQMGARLYTPCVRCPFDAKTIMKDISIKEENK